MPFFIMSTPLDHIVYCREWIWFQIQFGARIMESGPPLIGSRANEESKMLVISRTFNEVVAFQLWSVPVCDLIIASLYFDNITYVVKLHWQHIVDRIETQMYWESLFLRSLEQIIFEFGIYNILNLSLLIAWIKCKWWGRTGEKKEITFSLSKCQNYGFRLRHNNSCSNTGFCIFFKIVYSVYK